MQFKRFSKRYNNAMRKLIEFANSKDIKIDFVSERELGGGSGLYAPETNTIYVQNNKRGITTILILAHEIGHYISETEKGEVTDRQQRAYDNYPQKPGDKVLQKDAQIMRYIEARAIYWSNKLIKKLDIDLNEKDLEIDNLYSVIALEHIFDHGDISIEDRDKLWDSSVELYKLGLRWTDYYKDFL